MFTPFSVVAWGLSQLLFRTAPLERRTSTRFMRGNASIQIQGGNGGETNWRFGITLGLLIKTASSFRVKCNVIFGKLSWALFRIAYYLHQVRDPAHARLKFRFQVPRDAAHGKIFTEKLRKPRRG